MQSNTPNIDFEHKILHLVEEAISEDLGLGDLTTQATVPEDLNGTGIVLAKGEGILAGLEVLSLVFASIDPDIEIQNFRIDGESISENIEIARLHGSLASILKGERTALNFLQRMSGIATLTRKFVDAVRGTSAKITDTRKTAPGLRALDKLAVRIGGGINHRFGLDDMVLIKDNHIAAAGSITGAVLRCRSFLAQKRFRVKIEVETKSLAEVAEVLQLDGIDRIMLDNFTIPMMAEAVSLIDRKVEVEASGNVSLQNVHSIAETGVDIISVGALTHSVKALDISLDLVPAFGQHRPAS